MNRLFAVAIAIALAHSAPALADDGGTSTRYSENTLVVTAGMPGSLRITDGPGPTRSGPTVHCGWFELVIGGVQVISIVDAVDPEEGEYYLLNCWTTQLHEPIAGYPIAAAYRGRSALPGPAVSTAEAARYAVERIRFAPLATELSPPGRQVVGVPTWLAITSPLDYAGVSAAAGPVWATVRPEFRDVTWRMRDGSVTRCVEDADRRWTARGAEPSRCTHTFESGSRGAPVDALVTVRWTIHELTDKSDGAWGVWGTVVITAPVAIDVAELQAAIR